MSQPLPSPPSSSPLAAVGRRREERLYCAEDEALNQIAKEAEHRLAAKRAARAEARRIRMKELEKQQQEEEEKEERNNYDPVVEKPPRVRSVITSGSRRNSEVSEPDTSQDIRELKKLLVESEDKFNHAMVQAAQLDSEKSRLNYQVDTLKDELEEMEEVLGSTQKELQVKGRELTFTRRDLSECKQSVEYLKEQLAVRDRLIKEYGLIMVGAGDNLQLIEKEDTPLPPPSPSSPSPSTSTSTLPASTTSHPPPSPTSSASQPSEGRGEVEEGKMYGPVALLSSESVQFLNQYSKVTLDGKLKDIGDEVQDLKDKLRRVELDLDMEKEQHKITMDELPKASSHASTSERDERVERLEKDFERQVSDMKFRVQKLEQDNNNLQANVTRLDSQVKRQKTSIEILEESESELKQDKRKLTRELREAKSRVEELDQHSSFLQKRLDKMRILNRQALISNPSLSLNTNTNSNNSLASDIRHDGTSVDGSEDSDASSKA